MWCVLFHSLEFFKQGNLILTNNPANIQYLHHFATFKIYNGLPGCLAYKEVSSFFQNTMPPESFYQCTAYILLA